MLIMDDKDKKGVGIDAAKKRGEELNKDGAFESEDFTNAPADEPVVEGGEAQQDAEDLF